MSQDLKDRLQYIITTAEMFIDPTPNHPQGCAREAWISQAKYWLGIDFEEKKHAKMFAIAFCSSYDNLLERKGIDVEHREVKDDIKDIASTINWDVADAAADITTGPFTKRLLSLMKAFIRRNGGGNTNGKRK